MSNPHEDLIAELRARQSYKLGGPAYLLSLCDRAAQALSDLQARVGEETTKRESAEAKFAEIKGNRVMWPLEARDAVDALEERYDISLCSGQHHAEWVERAEGFEARAQAAEARVGELEARAELAVGAVTIASRVKDLGEAQAFALTALDVLTLPADQLEPETAAALLEASR